jgi:uncharacterized SAM-binding protein YcdF (DUF218 family)
LNSLFVMLDIQSWKPLISAVLLPPVPLLLLALLGARLILWRRGWGWLVVAVSVILLWLSSCSAVAEWLMPRLLNPPDALNGSALRDVQREAKSGHTAIVVLGGGRETLAPEYGLSNLGEASLARLRYGIWLSRETAAPLAFSGGTGHAQDGGTPEAQIAARIASREFGRPLRWTEEESRDTRENAARTVALLQPAGITHIVLVTHGYHMTRALRAFDQAAHRGGNTLRIIPAPMGLARQDTRPLLRWTPSAEGFRLTRDTLHETLGLWMGA